MGAWSSHPQLCPSLGHLGDSLSSTSLKGRGWYQLVQRVARETKQMIPTELCAWCPHAVNSSGMRSFTATLCCGFVQGSRIHISSWYREPGQQNSGFFFFFPGGGGGGADVLGLLKKKTHLFILGGDVHSWL